MSENADEMELLIQLHNENYRQGPGGDGETRRAIDLAGLYDHTGLLEIAEIGCGTGAAALVLAEELNREQLETRVSAVDLFPEFLSKLTARAAERGVSDHVNTVAASMDDLPFEEGAFDVIWSEGAIYNIGFARGVAEWKRFLKPGGVFVASEITWLSAKRPQEIESHWQAEYPEIDTAAAKMRILEEHGFSPRGYFVLPQYCWLDNYYRPLEDEFDAFLRRYDNEVARQIVAAEREEIALYRRFHEYYSYGVYIARRVR
jgi:SAM-dependent methyltransferase